MLQNFKSFLHAYEVSGFEILECDKIEDNFVAIWC